VCNLWAKTGGIHTVIPYANVEGIDRHGNSWGFNMAQVGLVDVERRVRFIEHD